MTPYHTRLPLGCGFHARTGIDDENYWLLTPNESTAQKLPKEFFKKIYVKIREWFGRRPQIQPSHVRDLLNSYDEMFPRENFDSVEEYMEVVDLSVNETNIGGLINYPKIDHVKIIVHGRDPPADSEPFNETPKRQVPPCSASRQGPYLLGGVGVLNATSLYGVTPTQRVSTVLLSDSSYSISKIKVANTAIRRRSSGDVLARGC